MEQIVLNVDDTVAKIYKSLDDMSKQLFDQAVSSMIKKAVNDAAFADYTKLLDDNGNEAVKNGLTPEILESLLAAE